MRKSARAFVLVVLSLLTAAVLGVTSAFMAAFALGAATALIVPGTGTSNANIVADYRENAADRYIAPFESCTSTNGCDLVGVDYPSSFWPLGFIGKWCPGFQCDTWNESVGTGVEHLDTALKAALGDTSDDIVLFGYSQGGAVVSDELRNIGDLTPDELSRLSVVMIGNAYNPDGGIFTRLGFLPTIPVLNVTFGPPMPTDTGIPITSIGFEYDPVMYAPLYWGNPLAMLNALAAFETVHGYYLTPNGNGPTDPIAYGYTEEELASVLAGACPGPNCRVDSNGNKYYMIPAKSLPIMDLVTSLLPAPVRPVVKPVVDLVSPVLKVLIDLGYDWSGDPGQLRFLSPLPFNPIQNWPAVGVNLATATVAGIQAFIGDLGGLTTTIAPTVPAPTSNPPVSTLAAAASADPPDAVDVAKDLTVAALSGPKPNINEMNLRTVDETTLQKTDPEAEGKPLATNMPQTAATQGNPSTTEDPFATKPDDTTKKNEKKDSDETRKGSVSLNFSPKKPKEGETGGATAGQNGAAGTTATAAADSEPGKAAA